MKKVKNISLHFFSKIVSIFSKIYDGNLNNKILIISTTGIGDTIWATPSIAYLHKKKCRVDIISSNLGCETLSNNPYVNQLICYNEKKLTTLKIILHCIKTPYSHVFLFHASQRIIPYIGYIANRKNYYGFDVLTKVNTLFSKRLNFSDFPDEHQANMRLKLVKIAYPETLETDRNDYSLQLYLTDKELECAKNFLNKHQLIDKDFVFIQPGASKIERQWHPKLFAKVVNFCVEQLKKKVVISGSAKEIELIQFVKDSANTNNEYIKTINGTHSVKEVASIIKHAALIITNDTGPMHLAEALNVPIIAFFLAENFYRSALYHCSSNIKSYANINDNSGLYLERPNSKDVIEVVEKFLCKQKEAVCTP